MVLHNFLIVERFAQQTGFDVFDEVIPEDDPSEQAELAAEMQSGVGQMRAKLFEEFVLKNGY